MNSSQHNLLSNPSGDWQVTPDIRHAMKIYSDFLSMTEYNEYVYNFGNAILPHSDIYELSVTNFTILEPKLINTEIIKGVGGENIVIKIKDEIVNLIIDNSGSMSWSDHENNRLELASNLIDKLQDSGKTVLFNISKFGGKHCNINLTAKLIDQDLEVKTADDIVLGQLNNIYGIRVVRKSGSYPLSPTDGQIVFDGVANSFFDSGLSSNIEYFYKIFTYDGNMNFSSGEELSFIYSGDQIPDGISLFKSSVLSGSGIVLDDLVEAVWHCSEQDGNILYDFSSNVDLFCDALRIGSEESSFGFESLRFDGESSEISSIKTTKFCLNDKKTIIAWITPYSLTRDMVVVSRQDNDGNINYILSTNSNGGLTLSIGFCQVSSNNDVLSESLPNFVVCTVDLSSNLVQFYVNGFLVGQETLSSSITDSGSMYLDIGYDRNGNLDTFFGEISEVSIHSVIRDAMYVSLYCGLDSPQYLDNGDRLVILKSDVPFSANYNKAKIIENDYREPVNESDGDVAFYGPVVQDENYCTFHKDFILGKKYNFKMFSVNSVGVYSNSKNSPNLEVEIPDYNIYVKNNLIPINSDAYPPLLITASVFNHGVYMKWGSIDQLSYPDAIGLKLYVSTDYYPTGDGSCFTGNLLLDAGLDIYSFTDNGLINGITYYYTFFVVDKGNRIIKLSNFSAVPDASLGNTNVDNLSKVGYELLENGNVKIYWDNIIGDGVLQGDFTQELIIIGKLVDDYGSPIEIRDEFVVSPVISGRYIDFSDTERVDISTLESINGSVVFAGTYPVPDLSSICKVSIEKGRGGTIRGSLTLDYSNNSLINVREIDALISLKISVPNSDGTYLFEYESAPINVRFINPLNVELVNQNNSKIYKKYNKLSPDGSQVLKVIKEYNGKYKGGDSSFIIRAYIDNLGKSINNYKYSYVVKECSKDLHNDDAPSLSLTNFGKVNVSVTPHGHKEEKLDVNGNPTGLPENVSYIEFRIYPSNMHTGIIYLRVQYLNYSIVKKMFFVFESPIQLEINPHIPRSDAIQIAEQTASLYIVDGADPLNNDKYTYIPQTNVGNITWSLSPVDGVNRYLIQQTPDSDDSGTIRGASIAPVKNPIVISESNGIVVYERQRLGLSVLVSGYGLISDSFEFSFVPLNKNGQNTAGSYFLIETDDYKQKIWADGVSYVKASISHNPNTSVTKNSGCFRSALGSQGKPIVVLNSGQSVFIDSGDADVEIIWGNVIEEVDPYTGESELDDSNASHSFRSAYITLSDLDNTNVYFRLNKNVTDQGSNGYENPDNVCGCFSNLTLEKYKQEIPIYGYTTSVNGGEIISLIGGGDIDNGMPPLVLVPQEPLDIRVVDKKANGVQIESIVIDAVTKNEIYLEVSYAGKIVPDDTPITVDVINYGEEIVKTDSPVIFTKNSIDPSISNTIKSYAILYIGPLPKNKTLNASIYASVNYDGIGTVSRSKSICLEISYDSEDSISQSYQSIYSNKAEVASVNNVNDIEWSLTSPLNYGRGHLVVAGCNNRVYAMGGINGRGITGVVEMYDPSSSVWTIKRPMTFSRMMAMSVVLGNYIYVVGGMWYDFQNGVLKVSNKVERYNCLSDVWETLSDMPEIDGGLAAPIAYGVACGTAEVISNNIYILGGVKGISEDGVSFDYNDKVLVYNTVSNTWSYSDDSFGISDIEYFRIFPLSFVHGNNIIVFGGAYKTAEKTNYITRSYQYNTTGVISRYDQKFTSLPAKRYKCGKTTIGGSRTFIFGGQSGDTTNCNNCEIVSTGGGLSRSSPLSSLIYGRNGSGAASYTNIGNDYVLVVGGIESGKNNDFLKIGLEVLPETMKLDAEQELGIKINLTDQYGNIPYYDVDIVLNGYIQFGDVADEFLSVVQDDLVHNIVKIDNTIVTTKNGIGYAKLLSRGDDVISGISEFVSLIVGKPALRYKIVVQATVMDISEDSMCLFKMSLEELFKSLSTNKLSNLPLNIVQYSLFKLSSVDENILDSSDLASMANNYRFYYGQLFIGTMKEIPKLQQNNAICYDLSDNVLIKSSVGSIGFDLISAPLRQNNAPSVDCVAISPWMGTVDSLTPSLVEANEAKIIIESIKYDKPVGGSPLFDAIVSNTQYLCNNEYFRKDKIIYIMSDTEPNCSTNSLQEAIDGVKYINKYNEVPLLFCNFSMNSPSNISYYNDSIGSITINSLCGKLGGQAVNLADTRYNGDIVSSLVSFAKGSIGQGIASFIFDLGEVSQIVNVNPLFMNCDMTSYWSMATSEDGISYKEIGQRFNSGQEAPFDSLYGRYIRFEIVLIGGLINNQYLDKILVTYIPPRIDYLYTKQFSLDNALNQITIATNSNVVPAKDMSTVEVGVSYSNTHNWLDYVNDSQRARKIGGDVIVPLRSGSIIEPLINLDGYIYRTTYGSWNPKANVSIYELLSNDLVDQSEYKLIPRDGIVIFKTKNKSKSYIISIVNKNEVKLGLRIVNAKKDDFIKISNIAFTEK